MTPALSGMTKLTQLPWPKGLTTPCLSLPPMYTWASCARRRGAQGSTEGPEFSLSPCTYPTYAWGHLAAQPAYLHLPPPGTRCALQAWHKLQPLPAALPRLSRAEPAPPLWRNLPRVCPAWGWPCGRGRPRRQGGGRAVGRGTACLLEDRREWVLGQAGVEGQPGVRSCRERALGSRAPRPLPLWLLLQEAAAWAAVPVLGGGRVVAGRGLDQECVSRNVAALPVGGGAGAGRRVRGS